MNSAALLAAREIGCEYRITPRIRGVDYPQAFVADAATPQISSPIMTELTSVAVVVKKGHAWVPQGLGLSIELDRAAVEKHILP